MKPIVVSAPGKLHLLGEHAVVFGKPAIITAVNRRSTVTLIPQKEKTVVISGSDGGETTVTEADIRYKTKQAREIWEQFAKTNDSTLLKTMVRSNEDYILLCIGETLDYFNTSLPSGFSLSISCSIPLGSGMGSSAAIAVSLVGAISLLLGKELDKQIVNEISYKIEHRKHGFPSGGDNAACCYGGCIWYQKTNGSKIIKPLTIVVPKIFTEKFIIIQTGIPEESTGEMVSMVRDKYQKNQAKIQAILNDQEQLVMQLPDVIQNMDEEAFLGIIKQGERNLEKLGVVSRTTQELIQHIEQNGGAAKICGAGGVRQASGIVLAYHANIPVFTNLLQSYKLQYSSIQLGVEGLQ